MMNGCILDEAPIAVDIWTLPPQRNSNLLFFLSHLHTDHTKGLTSSWRFPIYTSSINYKLAQAKFEFSQNVLRVLNHDVAYELPLGKGSFVNVTLINANHVPGSVMFLFQGTFGNILYTGDMRYYKELQYHPMLESILADSAIDVLYLDNTFCHPKFSFPPRDVVTKELLELISKHDNHYIKVGVRQLGKEVVLEAITVHTSELILIYPTRHKQMCLLDRQRTYTVDPGLSRIHAVDLNRITKNFIQKANNTAPTIGIMLTAMYYNSDQVDDNNRQSENIFILPYSDHSSYPELIQLVKELKPCMVKPIVKGSNRKGGVRFPPTSDMSVFDEYLSPKRTSPSEARPNLRYCSISPKRTSPSETRLNLRNCSISQKRTTPREVRRNLRNCSISPKRTTPREVRRNLRNCSISPKRTSPSEMRRKLRNTSISPKRTSPCEMRRKLRNTSISPKRTSPIEARRNLRNCSISPKKCTEMFVSQRSTNCKSPICISGVYTRSNPILDGEFLQSYQDELEEIYVDDKVDNRSTETSNEKEQNNFNVTEGDRCTNLNGETIITNRSWRQNSEQLTDSEELTKVQSSAAANVVRRRKRNRSSFSSIDNMNLEELNKAFRKNPPLDVPCRIGAIKEITDICSELIGTDFELTPNQTLKRDRLLNLLSELCE